MVRAAKKGAKKGQKKGGGGGGGGSGIPQAGAMKVPYTDTDVIMQNLLLVENFARKVGRPIIDGDPEISDVARLLFEAPFAVLAHDVGEEPKFNYANKAALDLFEAEWDQLVGMPSKNSTEDDPKVREERAALLKDTEEKGFSTGYSGWRVSLKGRRFCIHDAVLWNIDSPADERVGQAVLISHWEFEDGTRGGPGAPVEEGELEPAEAAVEEQAKVVRDLKEGKGLTNADEEVKAAVAELLARKEKVERIQKSIEALQKEVPLPSSA